MWAWRSSTAAAQITAVALNLVVQEASHESQVAANTAGGGDCHQFHGGMQEEKRCCPSHGEGVHGCRYDDEEIKQTCSALNPRPRTELDVLGTTAYPGFASSRRAHPAKAGVAKPRVL